MVKTAASIRSGVLAMAVAMSGCAASSSSQQMAATAEVPVPAILAPVRSAYIQTWTGGNADAMSAYFAKFAIVVVPGERYTGWEDILLRWLRPTMKGLTTYSTIPTEFMTLGEDIVERGRFMYTITHESGKTETKSAVFTQRWSRDKTTGEYKIAAVDVS
jgi:hypothetical protein